MSGIFASHLSKLIEVANLAIEADDMQRAAELAKGELREAYDEHKQRVRSARITAETPEWDAMMQATKAEYAASETAKRRAYNARRRLRSAIQRYRAV